jgi:hypothetical protein
MCGASRARPSVSRRLWHSVMKSWSLRHGCMTSGTRLTSRRQASIPLDGARYLAGLGASERIVNLIARHSNAILEAKLRGIGDLVAVFPDERGALRDALWYCDLTTSPDGEPVSAPDRIAEIKARYGPGHIVTQFITDGAPDLLAAVDRTERRLAGELGD